MQLNSTNILILGTVQLVSPGITLYNSSETSDCALQVSFSEHALRSFSTLAVNSSVVLPYGKLYC